MTKQKVYVASRYARRLEAAIVAQHLRDAGFVIVSTWHDGEKDDASSEEKLQGLAQKDLDEVNDSDIVLTLTDVAGEAYKYGSHHVEFGLGYAWGKTCILIGQKELMFHRLPGVLQFNDIYEYLTSLKFDAGTSWLSYDTIQCIVSADPSVVKTVEKPSTEAADRKATPICTGVLDYFPDALMEVARVSKKGNDQHNPGEPLHWAKHKSTDHADALLRHLKDRGLWDTDGQRHSAKVAWRALALLQTELEEKIISDPTPNWSSWHKKTYT